MAQDIRKVGVIGAGQMGSGIAHVCALAGFDVKIHDVSADRIKQALATINGNMARQVSKKAITEEQRQAALAKIEPAPSMDDFSDADLVIVWRWGGTATVTLGAGSDLLQDFGCIGGLLTVTDFAVGDGGDALLFETGLIGRLQGWDLSTNPFASGHLRLVQSGADAVLQIDVDGAAPDHGFVDLTLFKNVSVQDKSARDALNTFLSGKGDVLLTYENEAIAAQLAKQTVQYVIPKATILIENPIAVLKNSENKDTANRFLRYLRTPPAQQIFADYGYRPVVKSVLEANRKKFPKRPDLFTIDNLGLGGWDKVQKTFFDPNSGVMATIWSWPIARALRVCSTNAATSEPRKFSPSPRPMTRGELRRAPTTRPGWSSCIARRVNAPSRRETVARNAVMRSPLRRYSRPRSMAATSVSVSLRKVNPSASSSSLSSEKFSMMPLWITASLSSSARCGCALPSVGPPWVAQRVWPMPVVPSARGCALRSSRSTWSFPARLRMPRPPSPSMTAMPAES